MAAPRYDYIPGLHRRDPGAARYLARPAAASGPRLEKRDREMLHCISVHTSGKWKLLKQRQMG